MIDADILSNEERISFALRSLYHRRGYTPYRMSRFEDYELYMKNKDFLPSPEVISFTDTNGKLKALKPDVTLSIVRSAKPAEGEVQKLYYDENVYRVSESSRAFREIRQAGLECVGAVDERCIGEVLELALESLALISSESVLCVSHLGVAGALLDALRLDAETRRQALRFLGEKNLHELTALCDGCGADAEAARRLRELTLCSGEAAEVLPKLRALECPAEAVDQLEQLTRALGDRASRLRLDFSILGDMRYYNGVAFRGFVRGASQSVLSGGQYDRLLARMGKKGKAIGFACYLDQLERLADGGQEFDADVLLLYDESDPPETVAAEVRRLVGEGLRVSAQKAVPEKGAFRRILKLSESGVSGDA